MATKTCSGCKAKFVSECLLGYKMVLDDRRGTHRPTEGCPKPKTEAGFKRAASRDTFRVAYGLNSTR